MECSVSGPVITRSIGSAIGPRPARCPEAAARRSFTLIDILAVLLLLGLALAIFAGCVPNGHTTLDLTTGADGLANTLRLARARAISGR